MVATVAGAAVRADSGLDAARFRRWVVAATVLPWLWVIGAHHVGLSESGALTAVGLLLAAHVGTSVLFYGDPGLDLPRKDPVRYVLTPVAAVVVAVTAWLFGGVALTAVLLVQQLWSIHHFTRQNLGVFSLYARARGGERLTDTERRLFDLTAWAGMCGTVGLVVDLPVRWLGLPLLAAAVVLLVRSRPMPTWRLVALAAAVAFYLPLFLYPMSLLVATAAFGFAHGAQYLVMMGHLRIRRHWLLALAAIVGVFAFGVWTGVAFGLFLGFSLAHFIIDAGVWKMRDPSQRAWLGSRLAWL